MKQNEKDHDEMVEKLEILVDYLQKNGVHFLIIAGKNDLCARYFTGSKSEIVPMIDGMIEKNDCIKDIFNQLQSNKTDIK